METEEDILSKRIRELCPSQSLKWAATKAVTLKAAAARHPFQKPLYHSHVVSIEMYIKMLLDYPEYLSQLEEQIDALGREIEEFNIIQSISGIGEIDRFDHPKKLVAFASVNPSIFESGQFKGTVNRVTKRGSSKIATRIIYGSSLCRP